MKYITAFDTSDLTFITTANFAYVNFVEPFIHYCRLSNPGCYIEIWVDNLDSVKHITRDSKLKIHQLPSEYHVATYRYILTPTFDTPFYYITDVDIMHTEFVQPFHLLEMQRTSLPFSNIIRHAKPGKPRRLSGLHFVKKKWYNDTRAVRARTEPRGQDEEMLFEIADSVYNMSMVPRGLGHRPVHGMHCSVGKNPRDKIAWELTSQRVAYIQEETLRSNTVFNDWFAEKVLRPLLGEKLMARVSKTNERKN